MRAIRKPAECHAGMALVAVLLALLALLVLCTPFLLTARNASKSSSQLADRVQGRLALDAAERHARARLGGSHLARDRTPFWDDLDELTVDGNFDSDFWNVHDPRGVMWGAQVRDVSGRIDLNSAGPHVLANILGTATRLVRPVKDGDKEFSVSSTQGFDAEGMLYVEGELVAYQEAQGSKFSGLLRGLAAEEDADGNVQPCGPQHEGSLPAGAPVLDVRAFAPARWRFGSGEFRTFSFPEEVRESARDFGFGLDYDARQLESLNQATTVFAGTGAGPVWQHPARIRNELEGGIDCGLDVDEIRWFNPGTTVRISDGRTTEYGIVRAIEQNRVMLVDAVVNDYFAFTGRGRAPGAPAGQPEHRAARGAAAPVREPAVGRRQRSHHRPRGPRPGGRGGRIAPVHRPRGLPAARRVARRWPRGVARGRARAAPGPGRRRDLDRGLRRHGALRQRVERQRRAARLLDHALLVHLARRLRPGAARVGQRAQRRRARLGPAAPRRAHRAPGRADASVDAPGGLRRRAAPLARSALVVDGSRVDGAPR